jgi:hypothetical protein
MAVKKDIWLILDKPLQEIEPYTELTLIPPFLVKKRLFKPYPEQASQWVHPGRKYPRTWPDPLKQSEDPTQDLLPELYPAQLYRTQVRKILSYSRKCREIVEKMAVQAHRISVKHQIPIIYDAKKTFAPRGRLGPARAKYR